MVHDDWSDTSLIAHPHPCACRCSSITVECKNSGQFPRPGDDNDITVISIAPASQANPEHTEDNAPTTSNRCAYTNFPTFVSCYSPISAFTPRILTHRGFSWLCKRFYKIAALTCSHHRATWLPKPLTWCT